ncbi:larval cuticle protein 16/17-like [Photinus pyralis]|uniref:larval cuticle protein 16/17-like n=1 Tax=Photinus pyralis TaxID=7054 RepID=UPI001267406F|nr:larval cuticle protein 16/17-like [Photinus pyralis]
MVEWSQYQHQDNEKRTYKFGYEIEDPKTNNVQFRNEQRHENGSVTGSYGHLQPDGNIQVVHYVADGKGYRARIENSGDKRQNLSPEMESALRTREVYKKQTIFEQRLRPYDQEKEKLISAKKKTL